MKASYWPLAFSLERQKLKGTPVVGLTVLAPLFVVMVAGIASYLEGTRVYGKGVNPWIDFSTHILIGWTLFIFPIYVSLQSALLNGIEHQAQTWKIVYSLPLPKWSIYAAKLALFTGLISISHLVLLLGAEIGGWLLGVIRPRYGFQLFSLHRVLAEGCFGSLLSGLGMIAIQFYVGIRYRSFIISAGLGLALTLVGAIARSLPISRVSPYVWPVSFFNRSIEPQDWQYLYGWFGIMVFWGGSVAGCFLVSRRNVP